MTSSPIRRIIGQSAISAFLAVDSIRSRAQQYILLLAHMRSGSSLLLHILASNPEIAGCGELNSTYATNRDLARLALRSRLQNRLLRRRPTYVVDQLNHSRQIQSPDLLSRPEVSCVYLLREPAGAISSMTDVLGHHYGLSLNEACDYYRERLASLAECAISTPGRDCAFVLTYDELIKRPRLTLDALGRFLGLNARLTENYRLFHFTGKRGDPSRQISMGRIVNKARPIDPNIDPNLLVELEECYENRLRQLQASCLSVESG